MKGCSKIVRLLIMSGVVSVAAACGNGGDEDSPKRFDYCGVDVPCPAGEACVPSEGRCHERCSLADPCPAPTEQRAANLCWETYEGSEEYVCSSASLHRCSANAECVAMIARECSVPVCSTDGECQEAPDPALVDEPCTTVTARPCKKAICSQEGACEERPDPDQLGQPCIDADLCTVADKCVEGGACAGEPMDCGQVPPPYDPLCARQVCEAGKCVTEPFSDGSLCDDNKYCTKNDRCHGGRCDDTEERDCPPRNACDAVGQCVESDQQCVYEAVECSPAANVCSQVTCDLVDGCIKVPVPSKEGEECDDGLWCTEQEKCRNGECTDATPLGCPSPDACRINGQCSEAHQGCVFEAKECPQPADPCARAECDPVLGCVTKDSSEGSPCNDGLACTVGERCFSGVCGSGVPKGCLADDKCQVNGACVEALGGCVYEEKACPQPSGDCLEATCDPATGGCGTTPAHEGAACDDGIKCTAEGHCSAGVCEEGEPVDCSIPPDACHEAGTCDEASGKCVFEETTCAKPANLCLQAACNPESGCEETPAPEGTSCDDGVACTTSDACSKDGTCLGSPDDTRCDEGQACDPLAGCVGL